MAEISSVVSSESSDYDPTQTSSKSLGISFTSPTSGTSELHVHEDTKFSGSPNHETPSFSSPLSNETFDFRSLSIDETPSSPHNPTGRYQNPFQRGFQPRNDLSSVNYAPREPSRKNYGFRVNSPHVARGGSAHSKFRTGLNSDEQMHQTFLVIRNSMRRQFKHSDVAKWKFEDYKAHAEAVRAAKDSMLAKKAKAEDIMFDPHFPISEEVQENLCRWGIEGNFNQEGNRGRVLGEPTIWCQDWQNGKDEIAPWPTLGEQKWEGDDRSKTGVGRFLPLPREEGPPSLSWNQLPVVEQYPLDQTCRIPTMEDVYAPVDEIPGDEAYLYVRQDLMDAIDEVGNV